VSIASSNPKSAGSRTARTDEKIELVARASQKNSEDVDRLSAQLDATTDRLTKQIDMGYAETVAVGKKVEFYGTDFGHRLNTMQAALDTVTEHVGFLTGLIHEVRIDLSNRIDGLTVRFDALEARLDKLEARFDKLEARFDKLESRFDKVETRLDTVDAKIDRVLELLKA
jgi:chromosome segregation ATPase